MRTVPIIDTSRIVAIKTSTASPTKRDIRYAKDAHSLIDLTEGKATKSVLYLDSGQIILSADSIGMFVKYFPNQKVTYHMELFPQKKGELKMIYPTDDQNIKDDIDLICDNLFRICKVQCSDEKTLKIALTKEITGFMKGSGYHKDCKIS